MSEQISAVIQIAIDEVQPIKRIRAADIGKVTSLSDSIQQLGLLNPITVRPDYRLIAGLHRLEACKRLGWKSIAAIVLDYAATNDDETAELYAELAEIDENLIRNDLTELHQGIQHARRKVIYETLHPAAVHGGDRKSEAVKNQVENISTCSYATDAASATGVTERTVRNKTRIGEQLADVADLAPDWPKNLPRIFAWVYGGQPGAENAPRPLKITPWQNYFCGRLAPFPGTSQPASPLRTDVAPHIDLHLVGAPDAPTIRQFWR